MANVCGDNRFEIIAKVKEHLLKATNIEMQPEELKYADNILFRLWQLGYFNQSDMDKTIEQNIQLKAQIEEIKEKMLDKFYEICKFIVCLCGTILIVLFTVASIYMVLK